MYIAAMSAEDSRFTPQAVISGIDSMIHGQALQTGLIEERMVSVRAEIDRLQREYAELADMATGPDDMSPVVSEFYQLSDRARSENRPQVSLFYLDLAVTMQAETTATGLFDYPAFLTSRPQYSELNLDGLLPSWMSASMDGSTEDNSGSTPDDPTVGDTGSGVEDVEFKVEDWATFIANQGITNEAGKVPLAEVKALLGGQAEYKAIRALAAQYGVDISSPRGAHAALPVKEVIALLELNERSSSEVSTAKPVESGETEGEVKPEGETQLDTPATEATRSKKKA